MAKRTVFLCAEKGQVYQSLRCLSVQTVSENVIVSLGSSGGSRRSVFLRLGAADRQELQSRKGANSPGSGCTAVAHGDVFERLSDLASSQNKAARSTAITSGTAASTPRRHVGVQNNRIAQLAIRENCDLENCNVVEDLRHVLNRLRRTKEERKAVPRHLSPMIKFGQRENPAAEDASRLPCPLRRVLDKSTETIGQRVMATMDVASCELETSPPDKIPVHTKQKFAESLNPAPRESSGVHLSTCGPHWQAKAALHHEEFRRAKKWNFIQKRRGIRRHQITTAGSDVITMTSRHPIISRDIFSRKRQAPSVDHLVTPSKRPRVTG